MPTTPESYGMPRAGARTQTQRPGASAPQPMTSPRGVGPSDSPWAQSAPPSMPRPFPGQANGGVFPGQGRGVSGGFPGRRPEMPPMHSQPMPMPAPQHSQPMPMPQMPMGGGMPQQMPPQAAGGGWLSGGMGQADPAQRAMQRLQGMDLPPHVLQQLMARFGQ